MRFLNNFAQMRQPNQQAQIHRAEYYKIKTFTASWQDLSIIYEFFKTGSVAIQSKGLQLLLKDEFDEHDPDMLYSRFLQSQQNSDQHYELPTGGLSTQTMIPQLKEESPNYQTDLYILFLGDSENISNSESILKASIQ